MVVAAVAESAPGSGIDSRLRVESGDHRMEVELTTTHNGHMTSSVPQRNNDSGAFRAEAAKLGLPVTTEQRERTASFLQNAYADGRLTEVEFDERIGMALQAQTRRELNTSFAGLALVPASGMRLTSRSLSADAVAPSAKAMGGLSHLSALGTWVVGPAVIYATAQKGSYTKREAAKAFNFQALMALMVIVGGLVLPNFLAEIVMPLLALSWLIFTIVGAVKAFQGNDWTNPIARMIPLKVLDQGRRQSDGRQERSLIG